MFLGVDGGGTKTGFALIDRTGRVLARHEESSAYYHEVGIAGAAAMLERGCEAVLDAARVQSGAIDFAFFGLPAYGEDSTLQPVLDDLLKSAPEGVRIAAAGTAGALHVKGAGPALFALLSDSTAPGSVRVAALNALATLKDNKLTDALKLAKSINFPPGYSLELEGDSRLVLLHYHWPGNLRELRNTLRHAVALADGKQIGLEHLPDNIVEELARKDLTARSQSEASKIEAALRYNGGNVSLTARYLGVSRATLYRKIQIQKARGEA